MKKLLKNLSIAALLLGTVSPLTVDAAENKFDGQTVTVGVAGDDEVEVWEFVAELAEKEGITLEVKLFNDYIQPNVAVASGDLDLNAFQHVAYLESWNEDNKEDLQPIGFTYVSPMGAYSEKVKNLDELAEGAVISLPNDPTNGGRALLLLEQAGVIEVDDKAGVLPTVKDITKNDKALTFEELDAAQVASSLKDVDAAIINTNYALDNGLSLADDAIFVDTKDLSKVNEVYKNVVATRKDDVENELYLHIVSLYQSDEVADKIVEVTKGANVAAWK